MLSAISRSSMLNWSILALSSGVGVDDDVWSVPQGGDEIITIFEPGDAAFIFESSDL